jgi:hypothetical protein
MDHFPTEGWMLELHYLSPSSVVHVLHWTRESAEDHIRGVKARPDYYGDIKAEIRRVRLVYTEA